MKLKNYMDGVITLALCILFLTLTGCEKSEKNSLNSDSTSPTNETNTSSDGVPAVCLREIAFREEPSVYAKWKATLMPGLAVTYLETSKKGPVSKEMDADWFYLVIPGGEKGWSLAEAILENSYPAVIIEETPTYQMPSDVSRNRELKLKPMDAIAIVEEKEGWLHIARVLQTKTEQVWIKPANLSKSEIDIAVALQFTKETNLYNKKNDKKVYKDTLTDILKAPGNRDSIFAPLIDETIMKLENELTAETPTVSPVN